MVAAATEPQIIHSLPGRIRLRIPPGAPPGLKQRLEQIPGVSRVEVNPLTGNALISFQPSATDPAALLEAARAHAESRTDGSEVDAAPQPTRRSSIAERAVSPAPELTRARIPVRGIDRNP